MDEPNLHMIAGWGLITGCVFLLISVFLWRWFHSGVMAAYVLPGFLGTAVMIFVVSGGIWWATRDWQGDSDPAEAIRRIEQRPTKE